MAELRTVSPLLDQMTVGRRISSREGVSVYELRHSVTGQEFILKHIAIPASDEKVQALILSGAYADEAEANAYYKQVADSMAAEFEITRSFADCPYILKFLDQQIEPKASGIGYEVFVITEKAQSLKRYAMENAFSRLAAVNLGIDLCDALSALREKGYVHQNLKPENIFLSQDHVFMLGDIGYASMQDMNFGSLPEQYFSSCTAPELHELMSGLNQTIDIYSVGSILYQIYNGYHAPFVDEKTPMKVAEQMRFSGKEFPAPLYADYEMAEIILKACAYKPEDRYQTPEEMKQALEQYMQRNAISDTLIVPPIITDPEPLIDSDFYEETGPVRFADVDELDDDFKSHFAPDTAAHAEAAEIHAEPAPEPETPSAEEPEPTPAEELKAEEAETPPAPKKKKKIGGWIALAVVLLLMAGAAYVYFFTSFGKGLYHYFLHVDQFGISKSTATSIQAKMKSESDESLFEITCHDTYGNSLSQAPVNGTVLFEGLTPGTQYTLTVTAPGTHKVTGEATATVTTSPAAEILSFTASSGTAEGIVALNLVVRDDSTEPEAWTLEYGCDGEETRTQSFSGHELQLPGLTVGKEYTFRLVGTEDLYLLGKTEVTFTPLREVTVENLAIHGFVDGNLTVAWDCTSEQPEAWTVVCTDPDGNADMVETMECEAVFSGLELGKEYLVELAAPGLFKHVELVIPADLIYIDVFTAQMEPNGLHLLWSTSSDHDAWLLVRYVEGTEELTEAQEVNGREVVLTDLLPGTTYTFSLAPSNGSPLAGHTTVTYAVPAAEQMNDRGVEADKTALGVFLTPEVENWGLKDLGHSVKEVHASDKVSFALTCAAKRYLGNVDALYIVRNAEGIPVGYGRSSYVWNNIWVFNIGKQYSFLGSLNSVPSEPGAYTLEIYFSLVEEGLPVYQLAGQTDFSVVP